MFTTVYLQKRKEHTFGSTYTNRDIILIICYSYISFVKFY